MKVFYEGKQIGEIITNRSMTVDEALELLGIDPNERDEQTDELIYDFELFATEYWLNTI